MLFPDGRQFESTFRVQKIMPPRLCSIFAVLLGALRPLRRDASQGLIRRPTDQILRPKRTFEIVQEDSRSTGGKTCPDIRDSRDCLLGVKSFERSSASDGA